MSNITGGGGSFSSGEEVDEQQQPPPPPPMKKKRNLPGTPDPNAEVIALSPTTLMATNRFVCEICNKGFQRDQNLQLHRRGHNLPWKLRQRQPSTEVRKRVYVCPVKTCVHNNPSRALGDLTGIKKHYCRKHGEKKWKCDKCSKKYAVKSDWKAHSKTCGTREYRCDCGTLFSRRDSFITHRAFCDALAEENKPTLNVDSFMAGATDFVMPPITAAGAAADSTPEKNNTTLMPISLGSLGVAGGSIFSTTSGALIGEQAVERSRLSPLQLSMNDSFGFNSFAKSDSSATALLQKAAQIGATASSAVICGGFQAGVYDSRRSQLVGIGGTGGFFLGEAPGMFTSVAEAVYGGTGISCTDLMHARPVVVTGAAPRFGGEDVMTVNFLGRARSVDMRLHEQQQHQIGKVTWDV